MLRAMLYTTIAILMSAGIYNKHGVAMSVATSAAIIVACLIDERLTRRILARMRLSSM